MVYVITGGPATGKGTRADILAKKLNIPHISTGDILRDEAEADKEISKKLTRGELISDEIITELLKKRVSEKDCKDGFILDGYPRTVEQAGLLDELLNKIGKKVDMAIELTAPDELVFRRILERRKCEQCGKIYGLDFPPKIDDICDICGGKLSSRSDDTKETLQKRINTYKENSKDILEYYRKKRILKTIDSSSHPERMAEEVLEK
ncbi:MAG: nucleoside monophosphate kinase [Clostridia bacterium]|nr:nucleoside monophosphate kinase [Clostridia bacterium]